MTELKTNEMDRKVLLSTLWIFALFNYMYADILTLMDSTVLQEMMAGTVGGIEMTQEMFLVGAILMETAIVMVVLSRVLKYRANRWANIISGVIHTLAVFGSMFVGTPAMYYTFFAAIEIACTLLIIWLAWKWVNPEVSLDNII
jgi:hypothetical protein